MRTRSEPERRFESLSSGFCLGSKRFRSWLQVGNSLALRGVLMLCRHEPLLPTELAPERGKFL